MKGSTFNIGSKSTRRRIATVIALIGMVVVGTRLADVWPREATVAFVVHPQVVELAVDYLRGGEAMASARFRRTSEKPPFFQHTLRLSPGEYQVHVIQYGADFSPIEEVRTLRVPGPGVTRFDLREATDESP
jgi:hypothetical protein